MTGFGYCYGCRCRVRTQDLLLHVVDKHPEFGISLDDELAIVDLTLRLNPFERPA